MPGRYRSLRDRVVPGISTRADFVLQPQRSALLIIDIQRHLSENHSSNNENDDEDKLYYSEESFPQTISNVQKLAQAFRVIRDDPDASSNHPQKRTTTGCEVIWTYLQAATVDGRDISLDYKLSGPLLAHIPSVHVSDDKLFLPGCRPDRHTGKGDICLPKTSCSVFQSTNLDYMLRNLGIEQIVMCGQLTDQCVESAVRDAADLGYLVTVAQDACAAHSFQAHMKGLGGVKGFCRILDTAQVMDEIVEDLAHELMDLASSKSKLVSQTAVTTPLSEEAVLSYLNERGMTEAANHLSKVFHQTNLASTDCEDPKER